MNLSLQRFFIAMVALVTVFTCAFHSARATFEEHALEVSRSLFTFLEADHHGATRTLMVNGARLDLDSGTTDLSMTQLLDAATDACAAKSGGIADRIRDLKARLPERAAGLTHGVLRVERASEGLVACLTPSSQRLSLEDLQERFKAFATEGDLATLGGVQFLRAEKEERGVFFVTVRSVGSVPLWRMFPEHGDAPGVDFEDVPRLEGTRRVFSAWQVDGAPALNIYEASDEAVHSYETETELLRARGYEISGQTEISQGRRAGLFTRGSQAIVVLSEASPSGSLLTLMPLSAGPGMAVSVVRASDLRVR